MEPLSRCGSDGRLKNGGPWVRWEVTGESVIFFWCAFDRLLTLLWDNVWVGVRPGSENIPAASRVAGIFIAGGNPPRAATSLSCESLDEVSIAENKSGGEETGVS